MFKKAKPLRNPESEEHAYHYALFLLNLRLRTVGEMRKKMQDRGYIPKIIDTIILRLFSEKLLDDESYAEIYIENMKLYKQYGQFMMKKKLMEKLLPKDIIENKLNDLVTVPEEQKIALRYVATLVMSRAERNGLLPSRSELAEKIKKLPYEEKQKIMRKLLSRGFRMDSLQFIK